MPTSVAIESPHENLEEHRNALIGEAKQLRPEDIDWQKIALVGLTWCPSSPEVASGALKKVLAWRSVYHNI
jgi:hypothetical protein